MILLGVVRRRLGRALKACLAACGTAQERFYGLGPIRGWWGEPGDTRRPRPRPGARRRRPRRKRR